MKRTHLASLLSLPLLLLGCTTAFATPPQPRGKDGAEQAILKVLKDIKRSQSAGMMQTPREDGRLLRLLAESIGAKHVVEIGTSNGYSGIWFCLALRKTGGRLTTFEFDKRRAALARKNFKRAGVDQLVTLIEGDAHVQAPKLTQPIDLLFIDADKAGYVDYLKKLGPKVRPGGLIVAHNAAMKRPGITRYLATIGADKRYDTLLLNMHSAGVAVSLKKR